MEGTLGQISKGMLGSLSQENPGTVLNRILTTISKGIILFIIIFFDSHIFEKSLKESLQEYLKETLDELLKKFLSQFKKIIKIRGKLSKKIGHSL